MKYQNLSLFKKSLDNLSSRYFLVVMEDDYERGKLMGLIASKISNGFITRFSSSSSWDALLGSLWENSLWNEVPILSVDEVEKRKKEEIEKLCIEAFNVSFSGYLIIGSREKLYCNDEFEKRGFFLDLGSEKPWDRKKRFSESITDHCAQVRKSISISAVEKLLENAHDDFSFLEGEIDKVISYVGDKKAIQLEDILAISVSKEKITVWQIADRLIWKEDKKEEPFEHLIQDPTFFHTFLGALRYQLQVGYKLSMAKGQDSTSFAKMPFKILEKRKEQASNYGLEYFREGIHFLYKMDVLSKSGVDLGLLFDRIFAHFLQHDKNSISSS
jgi:DNA polymerase III delta subunit